MMGIPNAMPARFLLNAGRKGNEKEKNFRYCLGGFPVAKRSSSPVPREQVDLVDPELIVSFLSCAVSNDIQPAIGAHKIVRPNVECGRVPEAYRALRRVLRLSADCLEL